MFYCKNCGKEKGWPVGGGVKKSLGPCECCGKEQAACFDVPSKNLPGADTFLLKAGVKQVFHEEPKQESKKEEPKKEPKKEKESKKEPQQKSMSPDELFGKLRDFCAKYLGPIPSEEHEEYIDIEEAVESFQALFYLLLRDHVTVGTMNDLVKSIVNKGKPQFSDDILAAKADSLVRMLFRNNYEVTEIDASYEVR